jgi:Flp pilus assembly pilin Flp
MATFLRRLGRREDGAAAVEFALVLPLLVLLVFGIIEFGMAFRDTLTIASATRTGARTASALSRDPHFNDATVAAMDQAVSALPDGAIQQLWIYKADPSGSGLPVGHADFSSGCAACGIWNWDDASHSFVPAGPQRWDPATQDACATTSDSVGIFLKVDHRFVTQLFGADVTLTDHTVMRLEPKPAFQGCRP